MSAAKPHEGAPNFNESCDPDIFALFGMCVYNCTLADSVLVVK